MKIQESNNVSNKIIKTENSGLKNSPFGMIPKDVIQQIFIFAISEIKNLKNINNINSTCRAFREHIRETIINLSRIDKNVDLLKFSLYYASLAVRGIADKTLYFTTVDYTISKKDKQGDWTKFSAEAACLGIAFGSVLNEELSGIIFKVNLPKIKELELKNPTDEFLNKIDFPNLETIKILYENAKTLNNETLLDFANRHKNIKNVNFDDYESILNDNLLLELSKIWDKLESLEISQVPTSKIHSKLIMTIAKEHPTLIKLSIQGINDAENFDFDPITNLKHLKTMHFQDIDNQDFPLTNKDLSNLSFNCKKIQNINIVDSEKNPISKEYLKEFFKASPHLNHLVVCCNDLDDETLLVLGQSCPNLENLNVSSNNYTLEGFDALLEQLAVGNSLPIKTGGKLRQLTVILSEHYTEEDVSAWDGYLKEKYSNISFQIELK